LGRGLTNLQAMQWTPPVGYLRYESPGRVGSRNQRLIDWLTSESVAVCEFASASVAYGTATEVAFVAWIRAYRTHWANERDL
jgi:hypothetical protein